MSSPSSANAASAAAPAAAPAASAVQAAPLAVRVVSASVGTVLTSLFSTPLDMVKTRIQLPEQAAAPQRHSHSHSHSHSKASAAAPAQPATAQRYAASAMKKHAVRQQPSAAALRVLAATMQTAPSAQQAAAATTGTGFFDGFLCKSHGHSRSSMRSIERLSFSVFGTAQHSASCLNHLAIARQCHCDAAAAAAASARAACSACCPPTAASAVRQTGSSQSFCFSSLLARAKTASMPAAAAAAAGGGGAAPRATPVTAITATKLPPSATTVQALAAIVRHEGLGSLYAGLSPTLVMAVPSATVYYVMYDSMKDRIRAALPEHAAWSAPVIAGVSSRCVTTAAVAPLELVRTKMWAAKAPNGTMAALRHEIAEGGVSSLWRGLQPTLWRDAPFSGLYWFTYEQIKSAVLRSSLVAHSQQPPSFGQEFSISFVAGASAGMLSALLTQPFDVMKTQVQADSHYATTQECCAQHKPTASGAPTMRDTARGIYRARGWAGFFAGAVPRLVKAAPACAIMIASYESGKVLLGDW